jgi:hypothetical protein
MRQLDAAGEAGAAVYLAGTCPVHDTLLAGSSS